MKKCVFLPGTIALWLVLSGCTSTVYLVRTLPPEIEVPAKGRIGFLNRFDYQSNALIKDKHDTAYFTAIDAFAKALTRDTLPDTPFTFFLIDTPVVAKAPTLLLNFELPESDIKAMCLNFRASHLLTLDSLKIRFTWETIREEEEDGSVSKTKYFYLLSDYFLSLYDSSGVLIRKTLLDKSMEYTARPTLSGLITIVPNLARACNKIIIQAHEAGVQYTDMFYPSEERIPKTLAAGKHFEETNALIRRQEYDAAITLLEEMTQNPGKSLARKARQNLQVARDLKQNKERSGP